MIDILIILITIEYIIFIGLLIYGFDKIKVFEYHDCTPSTTFSIIVPFRNEERFFLDLLNSISNVKYPKELFEIIAVDDASSDTSVKIFNSWRFQNGLIQTTLLDNLRLTKSPKKDAISRAVPIVKNEWILTTDADCVVHQNWLLTIDSYLQKNEISMLAGAVNYKTKPWNLLHVFQQMDLMSLQGTTIGSFGLQKAFMCNGANFGYKKSFFNELRGFTGNENLASGDDVFLLQKAIKNAPEQVHYLKNKDAAVSTNSEDNIKNLFQQRLRWASKTSSYDSFFAKALAVVVLLINSTLVVGFALSFIQKLNWKIVLTVFLIKFIFDFVLLFKTHRFLGNSKFLFPILSSLIYPFFCCIVGIYSLFGSFSWKGRKF